MTSTIYIEKRIDKCKLLWEQWSTNNNIWDEWDIVSALFDETKNEPYFIVVSEGEEIKGLLPLQYNRDKKQYEFFGGTFPDSRVFWIEPKDFLAVYQAIPSNTKLFDIQGEYAEKIMHDEEMARQYFTHSDYRFYINLEAIENDFMNYLAQWKKEKRKNFLLDLRKVSVEEPQIEWSDADFSDEFIQMNKMRFKGESDFDDEANTREIKRLIKVLRDKKILYSQKIVINGKIEAVSMSAFHNNVFHALYASSNQEINNLGKLMHVENINQANKLKAKEIDFMTGENTWKELWKMDKEVCYSIIK